MFCVGAATLDELRQTPHLRRVERVVSRAEADSLSVTGLSDICWDLGQRLAALGEECTIVGAYDPAAVAPTGLPLLRIGRTPADRGCRRRSVDRM